MLATGRSPLDRRPRSGFLPAALALAAAAALACQTAGPAAPSKAPQPEHPAASAAAPAPAPSRPEPRPGLRASAPLPPGSVVELQSLRAEVEGVLRGDAAWSRLRAAGEASAAPEGEEYLLVRLKLTGAGSRSVVGCKDFRVTGSDRVAHFHAPQLLPEALEARILAAGESAEGWCIYSIPTDERGLILMLSEPDSRDPAGLRYLALEEGAALADPPPAPGLPAEPVGISARDPAPPGREVVTRDWSVNALEILRGDGATKLVASASGTNPPPADGHEFVAVKLHARYFGREGEPGLFSAAQFKAVSGDEKPYETPLVLDLEPGLPKTLLPGGEYTGWAVFQVARGDARAVLRFRPYYPDDGLRYLALAGD